MNELIFHQKRDPLQCVDERGHSFTGWREFECGGEKVCSRCGVGAMEHSIAKEESGDQPND